MSIDLNNDDQIRHYLLGELSDEEQEQLEERAFSDPEYLQTVLAVERDLIDEYVRGELSGATLKNFNKRFLASAERRRKVEFAGALAQVAAEVPDQATKKSNSGLMSWLVFWNHPKPAFVLSLAALVSIVIVVGFWFVTHRGSSESEQANRQVSPPASISPQPIQHESPPEQHAQNGVQPVPTPNSAVGKPVVASFVLLPGTARSADTPTRLTLAPSVTTVELRVILEKGDEYSSYSLELRTASGKRLRSQSGLSAQAGRSGRNVVLKLSGHELTNGNYELALSGINNQKQPEPLGYYYFTVHKD